MVQAVSSLSIAKKSLIGAMLVGASFAGIHAQNTRQQENTNKTEFLLSSEALKTNMYGNNVQILPDNTIMEYDQAGRIVKEIHFDDDCCYRYEYNPDGTSKCDIKYNLAGEPEWARFYSYEDDGTYSDITLYDDGMIWVRYYDAEDYQTRAVVRDENGKIITEYIYERDSEGNIKETIIESDGTED